VRSAATGATRVARRAGESADTSVTPMPTISATTIVRVASSTPAVGRPKPAASNRAFSARANNSPSSSPITEAAMPIRSASLATTARICRRVAPSVRSSANSRVRSATVIENVLKMMNAPTSSAAPANASSAGVRKLPISELMSAAVSSALSRPVETSTRSPGRVVWIRRTSSSGDTPSRALATIDVTSPSRSNQRCTSASGADTTPASPIEETPPRSYTPTTRTFSTPSRVAIPTRSPTSTSFDSAVSRSIDTSPGASGTSPSRLVVGSNGFGVTVVTRNGAPPVSLKSPSTIRPAGDSSCPAALATPSTRRTRSTSLASSGRGRLNWVSNASLGVTSASTPAYTESWRSSNPLRIWSVRM
jgi:hypothetical protein